MKLVTIVGARPQFIKAAALSASLKKVKEVQEVIIHTGQHYDEDMSAIFFKELELEEPDYHLQINKLSHGAMTGRMLEEIEKILVKEVPDMVIVFGDTNSTLSGALAARKLHIPVAHIEAGLRSFDMSMPEEVNRVLTDRISDLLFCPTETAVENLMGEGYKNLQAEIIRSGDIMFDASRIFSNKKKSSALTFKKPYVLCTIHREAMVTSVEKLKKNMQALFTLNENTPVVFIAHPRTRESINRLFSDLPLPLIPPLGYLEMLAAIKDCEAVITDSGGLQKEAYFAGKPCITLRNETEWKELITARVNFLAGEGGDNILPLYMKLQGLKMNFNAEFYGNGRSAEIIVEKIIQFLAESKKR